jgi:DNA-directed RNA polymerase I subunit RPA2
MQTTGFTIVADRLNFIRFFSHFQAIHRGSFYTEMKTTAIRKLLPEAWGFLCPVHTPDGTPCGLLNHVGVSCEIVSVDAQQEENLVLMELLASLGVAPVVGVPPPANSFPVILNGKVLGHIPDNAKAMEIEKTLRRLKSLQVGLDHITTNGEKKKFPIPKYLEIIRISGENSSGFPSLVLSTEACRFVRPVKNCDTGKVEFIGILEQVYLDILCAEEGPGKTNLSSYSHIELTPTNMLNVISNLTPLSDMNQSPRNMYQCQMSKHSMGCPAHNLMFRTDNKLLRLTYPQTPLLSTRYQQPYGFDDYPTGVNAIVAVISYTGYDMEDALILNKASVERGFMHASMFKTYAVNLTDPKEATEHFLHQPNGTTTDDDGLPFPGVRVDPDEELYSTISDSKKIHKKVLKTEGGVVDQVRVIGHGNESEIRHATVKVRYNRNPVIGDKFASRHGQKGVVSQLWAQTDMPFSDGGMVPDILFNPHGFPSRMTIGMLVEFLAGKSAALHGKSYDGTPFRFYLFLLIYLL